MLEILVCQKLGTTPGNSPPKAEEFTGPNIYSTVTDFARFLGLSGSKPFALEI